MEHSERREPLCLSDLLQVYHDFLLALSRRTERLIQDFNAFIQCSMGGGWPPIVIKKPTTCVGLAIHLIERIFVSRLS